MSRRQLPTASDDPSVRQTLLVVLAFACALLLHGVLCASYAKENQQTLQQLEHEANRVSQLLAQRETYNAKLQRELELASERERRLMETLEAQQVKLGTMCSKHNVLVAEMNVLVKSGSDKIAMQTTAIARMQLLQKESRKKDQYLRQLGSQVASLQDKISKALVLLNDKLVSCLQLVLRCILTVKEATWRLF